MSYDFASVESKWQARWSAAETHKTPEDGTKPKYYVLDMFPYPSGQGLHVGHLKGYVASDVVARFKRMQGYAVLHPMGWDAFGLPAERQAVKEDIHPADLTRRNVEIFRQQLAKIGLSYDWDREFSTTDPGYYKYTQWIFKKLFEAGLAYQAEVAVNWCPALNTVLANEEVKDGVYIETGDLVERRLMIQWMLRITAYADRLEEDLDLVDWPENVKEMQRQWIGRSEGTRVTFGVAGTKRSFEVFTTRVDTLFGCTFCTLAPEHPLIGEITSPEHRETVRDYIDASINTTERDRTADTTEATGVFTGAYATNPANGRKVPIWITDYVLMNVGTGAVFGCPAHDHRDHLFAKRFDLPIHEVVSGGRPDEAAYTGDGPHVHSGFLDGLTIDDAKREMGSWLQERDVGKSEVVYRLRDWLFSRQRYWGEPIPVFSIPEGATKPVRDQDLPVLLPNLESYQPTGDAMTPLSGADDWVNMVDPETGQPAIRETNTMPQWAGSSWYFLRFCDPHNPEVAWDPKNEAYWMPVDLYIGGIEHATLHLLYARFWHKFLYDQGLVSTPEPFKKLFNQGKVTARSFKDQRGKYYYPNQVKERDEEWFSLESDERLVTQIEKMSKSRYNVVAPEEVISKYGADSLRVFEAFLGPVEKGGVWRTDNIAGSHRFLERVNKMYEDIKIVDAIDEELEGLLHKSIRKIGDDYESLSLNTAVSQLMILQSELGKRPGLTLSAYSQFIRLLAPLAPHLAEECWEKLGQIGKVADADWPVYDAAKATDDTRTIVVQVNGKRRGAIEIPSGASQQEAERVAGADVRIARHLDGFQVDRLVYVPDRVLNFIGR